MRCEVTEVVRAVVVILTLGCLWALGRKENVHTLPGWRLMLAGLGMTSFGVLLDSADRLAIMNGMISEGAKKFWVVPEVTLGYALGFLFLAAGLMKWLPAVARSQNSEGSLKKAKSALEPTAKERTAGLRARESGFHAFLESSPIVACIKNREGKLVSASRRWIEQFSLTGEDRPGKTSSKVFSKDVAAKIQDAERDEATEILRRTEGRYRMLVESLPDAVFVVSDGVVVFCNQSAVELSASTNPGNVLGRQMLDFFHPDDRQMVQRRYERLSSGRPDMALSDLRFLRLDGGIVEISAKESLVTFRGRAAIQAVFRDISDAKATERQLSESLKEKEILLKEIHHRIKNNLAVVNSLLNLQSLRATDEFHRQMFQEAQQRIRSMAVAHENLHRSENLARVSMEEYIGSLVDHLLVSTGRPGASPVLKKEIQEASFELETAIPVGFIVTELVSNCLKHAFVPGHHAEITIGLRPVDGEYELTVSDNGVGIPDRIDPGRPKSLGLELVHIFVSQLAGTIDIARRNGTEITIRFKEITRGRKAGTK